MEKVRGVIGREYEIGLLRKMYEQDEAQLIAVYGRRRVGKTYLVKRFFDDRFDFAFTGSYNTSTTVQLALFSQTLREYGAEVKPPVKTWFDAFGALRDHLMSCGKKRMVVFLDEIPWMDNAKSNFLPAFSFFWNTWGSTCEGLKVVVCGSATTWMLDKFIGDKGGLYGRTNRSIYLAPFTLHETELFLQSRNIVWNRFQIAENYMIMGGIPYYLDMIDPSLPIDVNVNKLFFSPGAPLRMEYDFLFRTLFKEAQLYRGIVETLAKKAKGLTQKEIKEAMKLKDGGELSVVLNNLQKCDFIRKYSSFGKKEQGVMYQLTDLFILFHLHFVKNNNGQDENFWLTVASQAKKIWQGYAFEMLCLHHIPEIKKRLGISGVLTNACSWQTRPTTDKDGTKWDGAQIDLLLERADNTVNLCEMKFAGEEYVITRSYEELLRKRVEIFRHHTKCKAAMPITFITTYGLKNNMNANAYIPYQIVLDDLFG